MIRGFRDFILRGNVIDLAVAVVIGAAFAALVGAFSDALIKPVINSFFYLLGLDDGGVGGAIGIPGGQVIDLGLIFAGVITFLITAAVVYFIFVAPMNHMKARMTKPVEDKVASAEDLLMEIRDLLKEQNKA
jgi:large conductance mechanosensitive channel